MSEKKEINFDELVTANLLINTINLKGKDYAPVNERVIAFRRVYPAGQIITEPSFTENYVAFEAMVFDEEGRLIAKGHAREYLKNEFALEKAETSAVGRALGLCGFGISTSIASAEDMAEVDKPSQIFDEPPKEKLVEEFNAKMNSAEKIDFLNAVHIVDPAKVPSYLLMAIIKYKDEIKQTLNEKR